MALRNKKPIDEKVLDVDATMQGTLSFKDPVNLKINGRFEGTLDTRGNLTIGQTAEVKAKIHGDTITIAGRVEGDIVAHRKLSLLSTAILKGNISVSRFSMEDGAVFEGHCKMAEANSMNMQELSDYLEIETKSIQDWVNSGKIPAFKEGQDWRFDRRQIDEWVSSGKVL